MRMRPDQKEAARAALVEAAGRLFRRDGMAGIGIDALAREAGQTSGAVYAHFASKAELFKRVVQAGVQRLLGSVEREFAGGGNRLSFAGRYLSAQHRDAVAEGCLMPALSADIARADEATRTGFADDLEAVIAALVAGDTQGDARIRRKRALALLSLCAGGILLARAVPDGALSGEILAACRASLLAGETSPAES